jgi:hypothetical protein
MSSVRGVANVAARNATPRRGLEALARLGYFVKGVVYLIIGYFAVRVAIGVGGKTTDNRGALQTIYREPFGQFLLIVTTIGLIGYGIWSLIRALLDPDGKGTDAKGVISRVGYAVVGVAYLSLAAGAARLLSGSGSSGKSTDANAQDWTAKFLQLSYGEALVILAGVIVIGVGLYLLYYAFSADFMQYFGSMGPTARTWTERLGRFGYAAQGVVLGEIGLFLIIAARQHNAHQAKGIGGSLSLLDHQSYGHVLLAIVAIGLIAYGIYSWLQARFRRVVVS